MKEEIGTYRWLILRYLLVSLACFSYLNIKAAEAVGTVTDDYYNQYTVVYDDKTAILTKVTKVSEDLVIEHEIFISGVMGSRKLIGIADRAFEGSKIKSIRFIDGIEDIGDSAFKDCKSLEVVKLPPSLKSIGHNAFEGCDKLTNIYCTAYEPPTVTGGDSLLLPNSVNFYIPEATANSYRCASFPYDDYKVYKELDDRAIPVYRPDLILKSFEDDNKETVISIKGGETKKLSLDFSCYDSYYELTFQIVMPEGLIISDFPESDEDYFNPSDHAPHINCGNHNLQCTKSDNIYTFTASSKPNLYGSPTSNVFTTGLNLISFWVTADANFISGKIDIQNVEAKTNVTDQKPVLVGREKSYMINEVPVESIALDHTDLQIEIGETAQLKATLIPNAPTDSSVTWSSSDNSVATVSENGTVTGIKQGNDVVITAMSYNGYKARCTVTVTAPLYGDANKDKQLNQEDVEYIRDYILEFHNGLSESEKDRLDVNRDNKINVVDIVTLIELIQSGK